MKISNILFAFIAFVGIGFFASCEMNSEFYDELDKEAGFQLIENIDYTLTEDDYNSMGKDSGQPGKYDSFSSSVNPTDFLPAFLAKKYPTLDATSTVNVTYDYYQGSLGYVNDYLEFLEELAAMESYTLTTADYDSMGTASGQPGQYNNFSSSAKPEDYLPDFLLGKFPTAVAGDEKAITYKYYSGSVSEITEFWAFDGTVWSETDKTAPAVPDGVTIYELASADYDSMGEASGQPGKYNNFSGTILPENYLPTFVGIKFPYLAEGAKVLVLYKYYEGGGVTKTRAKEYTLTEDIWVEYSSTIAKTDQYIKTPTAWVFDPSVLHTMVAEDYQIIVDYVKNNVDASYVDSYGTAEAYYGAGAYYKNFDLRSGKYNSTVFTKWEDAVKEAIKTAYLPNKFPDAVAQVGGVDVNYVISFTTYDGTNAYYSITFKCTKSGPNPEFEYVEGPTAK